MKVRTLVAAIFAAMMGLSLTAGIASAATAKAPHITKTATCEYWTSDEQVSAVVVTSGINCSPTASFTIDAPPYNGATFVASDGTSAFSNYLQQIGEFVNGPGKAPGVLSGQHVVIKNAYTNNIATTVYEGPGNVHDGAYTSIVKLLQTGTPY